MSLAEKLERAKERHDAPKTQKHSACIRKNRNDQKIGESGHVLWRFLVGLEASKGFLKNFMFNHDDTTTRNLKNNRDLIFGQISEIRL